MKIKDGFVVREIAGENIAVATGARSCEFRGMITLNETGRFLWDILSKGADEQELCSALCAEYDVSDERARAAVDEFVARLSREGLLE